MRKILTFLFAALISVGMWAVNLKGNDTWDEGTKTLTVKSNPGSYAYEGESDIEHVIINNSVTSIGYGAFDGCTGLKSVTIGDHVTSIGERAFQGCENLESVTIPNSVTSIGEFAFYLCHALTSITIPNGVTGIGDSTFDECYSLTSITIPNSVTSIGQMAFQLCYNLESVTIPSNVTSIGYMTFKGCHALTSITIPDGVTSIGEGAFDDCTGLTSVTIGNSVTSIGEKAFRDCSGLTSITIPSSVTSIGANAFLGCTNITDVNCYADPNNLTWNDNRCNDFKNADHATFCHVKASALATYEANWGGTLYNKINTGVNVTFVGDLDAPAQPSWVLEGDAWDDATKTLTVNSDLPESAYMGQTEIQHVIISSGVTSIGEAAFYGCDGLTSVTIGNSVTSIGDYAFESCGDLTSVTIGNSVTSIGNNAFSQCIALTSITIPNSVTSIGNSAFMFCLGLESITIPNSVTSIGAGAFAACIGLTSIVVASGNTTYDSRDNCNAIIETSSNTLIQGCPNTIIPNGVTSIGLGAFYYGYGLTSIEIPNSVISIGVSAFQGCSDLTSVTIGNSVTSIGDYAFAECSGLTSITCHAVMPPTCGDEVFYVVDKSSIPLYVPSGSEADYQAADQWEDFTNIQAIPDPTPTDEQVPTNADPENPSYYYSTFFHSTQNYKLTNDGTTAFIADLSGNDLILTEIAKGSQVIPANTAVILRKAGSADPVVLNPTEENGVSVNPDENDLEGVDAITAVTSIDGLTRDNCYVLSGQQSVGFYLINSDNLKAHKAYVKYVSTPGQNNAPKKMRFVFNTTTGVESAQPSVISGQKLIENGQLIIIKNGVRYNAQGQIVK